MPSTQYRTSADLINEVLANLGVLSPGNAPDPEDVLYVLEKLDAIFRQIAGLDIVYVPDANSIPGAWFSDLADIVAGSTCTKFGATPDDVVKLVGKGLGDPPGTGSAAKSLKQMLRGRATYEVLRTEYF